MEEYFSKKYIRRFEALEFEPAFEDEHTAIDLDSIDWIFIAMVLDKFGFLLFIFLVITTVFTLLLFIPTANNWGL